MRGADDCADLRHASSRSGGGGGGRCRGGIALGHGAAACRLTVVPAALVARDTPDRCTAAAARRDLAAFGSAVDPGAGGDGSGGSLGGGPGSAASIRRGSGRGRGGAGRVSGGSSAATDELCADGRTPGQGTPRSGARGERHQRLAGNWRGSDYGRCGGRRTWPFRDVQQIRSSSPC